MGPFQLSLSSKAEIVDLPTLDERSRTDLLRDVAFDSARHQLYRLFVTPVFLHVKKSTRFAKKKSYSRVDRALIQVRTRTPGIEIVGIYPVTRLRDGQESMDFEGESILELSFPNFARLRIMAKLKDKLRKNTHLVVASRMANLAQWVFFKNYVRNNTEYKLQILCVVPRDLPRQLRFVLCDATFSRSGRAIESFIDRKVMIPQ
ncbi:MAG: hypothetical protein FJ215_01180 [Ignavibacteria bacterium]|nr:hypothetical protein [Ignavibacteria bacterium]